MENAEVQSLLKKYQQGTATDKETALLESWYLKRDGNPISELTPDEFSEDLAFIAMGLPLTQQVRRINWWPRIAAAAAILAIFFTAYLQWPVSQNHSTPVQLTALDVPLNNKKQLTLADGSQVWVNEGSELRYPKAFNGKTREVYLSGEAYFDIKHDVSKPFIIHTGKVITTVLGTAFNIKEDKTQHTVVVTVTRGKVSVANGNESLGIITHNQQISFNIQSNKAVQQAVDAALAIAWQKIDLHFEDQTFAEVAKQLEERFKVKITFSNNRIKNCRFTGASLTGEKLEKVIKTICDFNNATYATQPDGSIIIDGPGCDN